ncbi:hypothetical protein ONS95_010087 [Cadophora gregata]|uniref:uncharacterized protein n=1 Tax=Cadophora gregata TaxID=51156 RepID=UPI0026DBAF6E|nr:uncharacterized protein ONS95_010087 [Cadophora gregata]KAK0121804.1 hypothetical protein ONS95_010087 [Cadophora gregata]
MYSIRIHVILFVVFLGTALTSPIASPQIPNITPQSTDTTAMAQAAALQASQEAAVSPGSSSLINGLLASVFMAPAVNMKVSALTNILTLFEQGIAKTLGVDTTASSTTCAQMMVIFARGTTEPGNVGLFSGPPFFDALEATMGAGAVSVQGVEYSANIEGFLQGGDPAGSATMARMIETTTQNCPNAKIVMSGYSQGGQLVHNAAAMLPVTTMAKVSSVVIFGDPNNGKPIANVDPANAIVICHGVDNICDGGDLILVEHLTYSRDAGQAAEFAADRARA